MILNESESDVRILGPFAINELFPQYIYIYAWRNVRCNDLSWPDLRSPILYFWVVGFKVCEKYIFSLSGLPFINFFDYIFGFDHLNLKELSEKFKINKKLSYFTENLRFNFSLIFLSLFSISFLRIWIWLFMNNFVFPNVLLC